MSKHQYLISEVGIKDDIRFVKIHNPHNKADDIKRYFKILLIGDFMSC